MAQQTWYEHEMQGAVLPDARFAATLPRLVGRLARRAGQSFSRALGHDGRQTARRLGRRMNGDQDYQGLLAGHYQATAARCQGYPTVLAVQDTTVGAYHSHAAKDLGPVSDDAEGNGLLAHSCLAVTTSGVSLGLLEVKFWARDPAQHGQKAQRRERLPEEKESARWRETVETVQSRVGAGPEVIFVGDSESDNFYLLSVPRREGCHLLVRMAQARSVVVPGDEQRRNLLEVARVAPEAGHKTVQVLAQRDRRGKVTQGARRPELAVSWCEVVVQPPERKGLSQEPVRCWVVRCWEPSPPAGVKPLEWVLVSTKPVASAQAALQLVGYYELRWKVERLHYVLKSGMGMERLQVRGRGEVFSALALLWIAGWRVLWLTHEVREHPAAPAGELLSSEELKVLQLATRRVVTTALEAARALAKLAGAEEWKNAPMPGEKRLWMGLEELNDLVRYHRALVEQNAIQE